MKTKLFLLVIGLLIAATGMFAQTTTETIKVNGECSMCKARIEKAALSVDGVLTANWSIDRHILTVKYDKSKTNSDQIQRAIAAVGHDTEKYRADDEVYNNLPSCCHYDRSRLTPQMSLDRKHHH